MKIRRKITALATVILMLLMQASFAALAEETTDVNVDRLSPDSLPDGRVERTYNAEFNFNYNGFNGGFNQYSWHIVDGELPPGLTLYPESGPTWEPWINGTPTKAGTYTFTIEGGVTNYENGKNVYLVAARKTYTLTILPAYPLEISQDTLGNNYAGYKYTDNVYLKYQRKADSWKLEAVPGETLPEGLTIDSTTGDITWAEPIPGKYNLKITAVKGEESVSKVLKLIMEPKGGCTHPKMEKTAGKPATCKENGTADYWYCDDCERYFLDAEGKRESGRDVDSLYTIGSHSDKDGDGICDTCQRAMPIFKKITSEDEITSGGMYLVVSEIDGKYYTLKTPDESWMDSIEAIEIEPNSDGTFPYPESDTDVMILKTEFASECGELDANLPRYSLGTVINGIPYSVSSDDYGGSVMMDSYSENKYGYRMPFVDGKPQIASVYSQYWFEENTSESDILKGFKGINGDTSKLFFSLRKTEAYKTDAIYDTLTSYPISLYKLTYTGKIGNSGYTIADSKSIITIDENEFTVVNNMDGKVISTVGGISDALNAGYVASVIPKNVKITSDISATTYADITLKKEEKNDDVDYFGRNTITSLTYSITPKIKIEGGGLEEPIEQAISDESLNGSEMTIALFVGNMNPQQIIHHKTDGTREYFYNEYNEYYERSPQVENGAKSFSGEKNTVKGAVVTFKVDSFSDIEILATSKEMITVGNATVTAPVGGQTPSFTAVSDDSSCYSVKVLHWIDVENKRNIDETDLTNEKSPYYNYKFKAGKEYEAVVAFTEVGDNILSYSNSFTINGKETNWMGNGLKRTYTFTAKVPDACTNTTVEGNKFTVTGTDYISGYNVILALYKEDAQGNSQLVDVQTAVYNGSPIEFTATASGYTSAKVMVWNSLKASEPVTKTENVALPKSN